MLLVASVGRSGTSMGKLRPSTRQQAIKAAAVGPRLSLIAGSPIMDVSDSDNEARLDSPLRRAAPVERKAKFVIGRGAVTSSIVASPHLLSTAL